MTSLRVATPRPRKVERRTIADATTDELRRRIISGELTDGEPLRQDMLAEEMGVSRIPVREALARLESEGLVASVPHKGAVVTALSRNEILELFELRAMLEPELLRRAIPRMTPAHLDEAAHVLAEYERAFDNGDVHAWGEVNTRYHLALYAASDRKKSIEIVRSLLVNTDRYTRLVLVLTDAIEQARDDHGRLLELCRRGAVEEAVELTRAHIENNSADLIRFLDQQEGEKA